MYNETIDIMKSICIALVCLSVVGGLIDCTPFSPMGFLSEDVLTKKQPESDATSLDPREILKKLVKMITEFIPGTGGSKDAKLEEIEKLKEQLKNLPNPTGSPMGDILGLPHDITKKVEEKAKQEERKPEEPKQEEPKQDEPKQDEPIKSEATDLKSRKRRNVIVPATKVLNKPRVEGRYAIDNTDVQIAAKEKGRFLDSNIMISDPDLLDGNKGPVVIIIKKLGHLSLKTNNPDDDCDDCA